MLKMYLQMLCVLGRGQQHGAPSLKGDVSTQENDGCQLLENDSQTGRQPSSQVNTL